MELKINRERENQLSLLFADSGLIATSSKETFAQVLRKSEGCGGGAVVIGGDQVSDVTLIERLCRFRGLFASGPVARPGWRATLCSKSSGRRLAREYE